VNYLKKNQNDVVLVKKIKKSTSCNQVLLGRRVNPPGYTGFFLPSFFLQPDRIPAPDPRSTRQAGPGFKTMMFTIGLVLKLLLLFFL
jgi:hypothetical protein